MRRLTLVSILAFVAGLAQAGDAPAPLALAEMGSFHVGGRDVRIEGRPVHEIGVPGVAGAFKIDPNGVHIVGGMYVQYFVPAERRGALPLLLWRGGSLTGVTWETTPDGREGWATWFLRRGWPVYVSDAVDRGRSGFGLVPEKLRGEPIHSSKKAAFERHRIGVGTGSYDPDPGKAVLMPGTQFPVESYDSFVRQGVPMWLDNHADTLAAYLALVDRVCPCAVIAHSQAALFALPAAEARPDKIKALILVEPAIPGSNIDVDRLIQTPMLAVYGDHIPFDMLWTVLRQAGLILAEDIRAAGGMVDVIDLPTIGVRGNSHMMMMDKNSDRVAGVLQGWLTERGLYDRKLTD